MLLRELNQVGQLLARRVGIQFKAQPEGLEARLLSRNLPGDSLLKIALRDNDSIREGNVESHGHGIECPAGAGHQRFKKHFSGAIRLYAPGWIRSSPGYAETFTGGKDGSDE